MQKKDRKKRKRDNKRIFAYSVLAVMIAVVIYAAIYQAQLPHEKLQAADYFRIAHAIVTDADWGKSTDTVLLITQVRFNLTAVGGHANSVLIFASGMTPTEDWPFLDELKQNETKEILLPITSALRPFPSRKTSEGFYPLRIRIDSVEASGYITILL